MGPNWLNFINLQTSYQIKREQGYEILSLFEKIVIGIEFFLLQKSEILNSNISSLISSTHNFWFTKLQRTGFL